MRPQESVLEKKCCLSPTRRNRSGTKGRASLQVPRGVRQNVCREKLMRQTPTGLGKDPVVQERMRACLSAGVYWTPSGIIKTAGSTDAAHRLWPQGMSRWCKGQGCTQDRGAHLRTWTAAGQGRSRGENDSASANCLFLPVAHSLTCYLSVPIDQWLIQLLA